MNRKETISKLPWVLIFIVAFLVFRNWFSLETISAGDLGFLYSVNLKEHWQLPLSWESFKNLGLGGYALPFQGAFFYNLLLGLLERFFDFNLIERIIWFWPFLILTIFSSWCLAKTFFPKDKIIHFFAPFIYLFNPYILMVAGGGQMGIVMAYAIAPLLFSLFILNIKKISLKYSLLSGLALGLSISFDPRISFLTIGTVGLYWVFSLKYQVSSIKYLASLTVPIAIAVLLHFYWLLPLALVRRPSLPPGYGEPGWVEFLSFADFSNSLSLLHPNWPENIFGKTYFMRPEFLILPLIAFSSLLFLKNPKSKIQNSNSFLTILFFAFLSLLGAFLAKGSKPPFGEVYLWLFKYFPGMNLFRDPTKFYLLVALSYSMLIPFSLEQISRQPKKVSSIKYLVLSIFILYWLFLIRPAWLGQLSGTFKAREVPVEYIVLKDFINSQAEFFRTFWIPKKQRFGFFSHNHPAIESPELLSKEELAVRGAKYVIIPFDSEGEIFLRERKYDHQQRLALEEELDKVSWLKKIDEADKIAVYETPGYKDHFFTVDEEILSIDWRMVNPTKYIVRISEATQPFELVFSETYDELWRARMGEKVIASKPFEKILNSFEVDKTGDFELQINFTPQKYVYYGGVVSLVTLLLSFGGLIYLKWQKKPNK